MAETIFNRIIAGEVPCHKVYEDEWVLSFLDVGPLSVGHTLVIPKQAAEKLHQLSEESAAALGRALPRIAKAVMAVTGTSDYNILQNNGAAAHQAVMHVHFHISPKYPDGSGLGIGWKPGSLGNEQGAELAAKIAAKLR